MAAAGDEQQRRRVSGAESRDVHRERFAVHAQQRMAVRTAIEARRISGGGELAACFGVTLREARGCVHFCASQASAMRTQAVAPSGISSSLKS